MKEVARTNGAISQNSGITYVPKISIFSLSDLNGILSIQLSDDVMMPFDDGSFVVMIDDVESDYVLDGDTMNISFNSNNEKIEIF